LNFLPFDRRRILSKMSISARLAIGYTLSAFLMMAVVTFALYWILMRGLVADEKRLVLDKARMFETTLRSNGDDMAILENEVYVEGGKYWPDQHFVLYSRILDERGRVIIEAPGMEDLIPISAFPAATPFSGSADLQRVEYYTAPNGHSFYVMSALAPSGGQGGPLREIQVAMDETGERHVIQLYQRDTLIAVFLGTLVFAVFGVFVARFCLRPVSDLARHTERITAQNTLSNVSPDSSRWPKELTLLADSFYKMLNRIDHAFKALSRCTEDMAHELRSPINRMRGETEVVLSKDRTPEEYRCVLESSLEECERLSRLIKELLFIAGAENPHNEIRRERLDVHEEFVAVQEFHDAQAQELGVAIHCSGRAELHANRAMFRRAISNLVSNSLSHMREGDRIYLVARQADEDGDVEVSVTDTGSGISAADLPYVFDRFYRRDRTSLNNYQGSGLGLPIVNSIMTLHGGTIAVESKEGAGTSFTLRFRAGVSQAADFAPSPAEA